MFDDKDFYRKFDLIHRLAVGGLVLSTIVSLGVLGFVIWVAVKLLGYFGVI